MLRPEFYLEDTGEIVSLSSEIVTTIEQKVARVAVFFLLMFQSIFHLSDAAVNVLFHFVSLYFKMLSKVFHSKVCESIHHVLPTNISAARWF